MSSMTRREVRDCAFKLIFEKLLRDDPIEELYAIADEVDEITVNDQVRELVEGTLDKTEELDLIISEYSSKRELSRIAKINIAVLRIALYEILYDEKTPMNAAINEAVQLSQTYAQQEDVSFVNGVLGAYARAHSSEEG